MAAARAIWKQYLQDQRKEDAGYDGIATLIWAKATESKNWRLSGERLTTSVAWLQDLEMDTAKLAAAVARLYEVDCKFVMGDESPGWFEISIKRPADLSDAD
jgi:hypothetical protein